MKILLEGLSVHTIEEFYFISIVSLKQGNINYFSFNFFFLYVAKHILHTSIASQTQNGRRATT